MSFQDFKDQTTRAVVSKTIDGILSYTNSRGSESVLHSNGNTCAGGWIVQDPACS